MTTPAWISLGSNLGDRRAILDEAVTRLARTHGVAVTAVSTYRETRPVGGPPGQGPFLNAAARLDTSLSPRDLLGAMQAIERDLGRVRTVRWGERTLDLDILIYGSKFVDEPDLKLPHPRLVVRRFVLEPLAEIAPNVVDTITFQQISGILAYWDRRPRALMLDRLLTASEPDLPSRLATELEGVLVHVRADFERPLPDAVRGRRSIRIDQLLMLSTIRATFMQPAVDRDRWTLFDFAVDIGTLREQQISEVDATNETLQAWAAIESPNLWLSIMIARCLRDVPETNLIIASAGTEFRRRPRGCLIPVYWPEATEPDAIVAEVVAVCRGIEGG